MISAIIIDDEQHCIDRLQKLTETFCAGMVKILGTAKNVRDGLILINSCNPELIFLDVQLGEDTGFELLLQVKGKMPAVIFTTAYDRFAVKAFKFSAVDYLLKPIDPDELVSAIAKVRQSSPHATMFTNRFDKHSDTGKSSGKIIIPTINGLELINLERIVRCEADVNYTTLFLKDGSKLMVAKTLKNFEDLLGEEGFFRIHKSHIINLNRMIRYNKGSGGSVTLDDGSELPVSVRRKEAFLDLLYHS